MHKTRHDLPVKTRQAIVKQLNEHLATLFDLALQAKQAHWNTRGPNFSALHRLYDDIADKALSQVDLLAERIGQLGGSVASNAQTIARKSHLTPLSATLSREKQLLTTMARALATTAKIMRQAIEETDDQDDEVTSDIATTITRELDHLLWLVEAHLQ